MTRTIFHADLDAFFASVESTDNPLLKGKPVIVGGAPGSRGVVSACSYEARVFGVRSAMPMARAARLCPQGVFLPVRMHRYIEVSRGVMNVFAEYTPDVLQISVDEAFLDMSGTGRLFGTPREAATAIKARVFERFGLTVSVGIAPNRYIAKLASEHKKPDGLFEVEQGQEIVFLDSVPLKSLWGVGQKTLERLSDFNVTDVPGLRAMPEPLIATFLGKAMASFLYQAVRGIDPGIYEGEPKSRSMSTETTFETDRRDMVGLKAVFLALAHELQERLLDEGLRARTVGIKIRYHDFETREKRRTLKKRIVSAEEPPSSDERGGRILMSRFS